MYRPQRLPTDLFVPLRAPGGPRCRVHRWGDEGLATPERPPLVMVHGWMDVGASFQFAVDALARAEGFERLVYAPDWRGYGRTQSPPTDSYWFPDYLGDLDALLDALSPDRPVDLLGHSMGGNVVMLYAGVRPERIRRLVNLEGFGMPASQPEQAPQRLREWLDALKQPASLASYASAGGVAARLRMNNPRLPEDKAEWLARQWAEPRADGRWHILGDPAHKRPNPQLYRVDEVLSTWKRIAAPLLWVEAEHTRLSDWWGERYPREEFDARLAVVPRVERHRLAACGHMLHHDQPEALAALLADFLAR